MSIDNVLRRRSLDQAGVGTANRRTNSHRSYRCNAIAHAQPLGPGPPDAGSVPRSIQLRMVCWLSLSCSAISATVRVPRSSVEESHTDRRLPARRPGAGGDRFAGFAAREPLNRVTLSRLPQPGVVGTVPAHRPGHERLPILAAGTAPSSTTSGRSARTARLATNAECRCVKPIARFTPKPNTPKSHTPCCVPPRGGGDAKNLLWRAGKRRAGDARAVKTRPLRDGVLCMPRRISPEKRSRTRTDARSRPRQTQHGARISGAVWNYTMG